MCTLGMKGADGTKTKRRDAFCSLGLLNKALMCVLCVFVYRCPPGHSCSDGHQYPPDRDRTGRGFHGHEVHQLRR